MYMITFLATLNMLSCTIHVLSDLPVISNWQPRLNCCRNNINLHPYIPL